MVIEIFPCGLSFQRAVDNAIAHRLPEFEAYLDSCREGIRKLPREAQAVIGHWLVHQMLHEGQTCADVSNLEEIEAHHGAHFLLYDGHGPRLGYRRRPPKPPIATTRKPRRIKEKRENARLIVGRKSSSEPIMQEREGVK
jgi:hypothetical protein